MKFLDAIFNRFCDKLTRAIKVMDYEHHEIHEGSSFMAFQLSAVNDLDIATPLTFSIITPATMVLTHLAMEANLGDAGYVEIFEDNGNAAQFDISGGTPFTPVNRNRYLRTASVMHMWTGVTVTQANVATRIFAKSMVNRWGGEVSHREELILDNNRQYLIRLSTYADNNEGSLNLNWYEHTQSLNLYG